EAPRSHQPNPPNPGWLFGHSELLERDRLTSECGDATSLPLRRDIFLFRSVPRFDRCTIILFRHRVGIPKSDEARTETVGAANCRMHRWRASSRGAASLSDALPAKLAPRSGSCTRSVLASLARGTCRARAPAARVPVSHCGESHLGISAARAPRTDRLRL